MTGERLKSQTLEADDIEFLKGLYIAEYEKLVNYSRYILSEDIAEDLVQDAFLLCTLKIAEVKEHQNPIAWLYSTVRNLAKNERRRQAVVQRALKELGVFNVDTYTIEEKMPLSMACNNWLIESDWDLLYDYYCKGVSYPELAKQRETSIAACKMRVMRAKKILKKYLEEAC